MLLFPAPHTQNRSDYSELCKLLDPVCPGYHIDIMDGVFVPNDMGSVHLTNAIDAATQHPLWVHLMVESPLAWIPQLTCKKNSIITVHYEAYAEKDLFETLFETLTVKRYKKSIALNPETPAQVLEPFLSQIDHVTIMGVQPGAAGQSLLEKTLEKAVVINAMRKKHNPSLTIALDGGVNLQTAAVCKQFPFDATVSHSALFQTENLLQSYQELLKALS